MPKDKKDDQPELPAKVDDWKAPWEVDSQGEAIAADDQKLDGPRLKKYLFGLLSDKQRLRTQVNELTEARTDLERQIAEATDPKKIEELQGKIVDLQKERDAATSGTALENLKLQVALEKGLTAKQVKRLVGITREELEADADELIEDAGGKPTQQEEVEEVEGQEAPRPRRITNAGDPKGRNGGGDGDSPLMTPEKFAEQYAARKALGYN